MRHAIRRAARRLVGRPAVGLILLYHRVREPALDPWGLCVDPRRFAEHLELLQRRFRPLDLGLLLSEPVRRHGRVPVAITFDDGYRDNLEVALPILESTDVPATFFVAGSGEQDEFWWDELDRLLVVPDLPTSIRLERKAEEFTVTLEHADDSPIDLGWRARQGPRTPRERAYLALWEDLSRMAPGARASTIARVRALIGADGDAPRHPRLAPDEIASLAAHELATVGAHTLSHSRLSALSADAQLWEVAGSRASLESITGRPVERFSYPFGGSDDYGTEAVVAVRAAGFALACRTGRGAVGPAPDRWQLPRVNVPDIDAEGLERRLTDIVGR